jgi:hypothetical protein
MRPKRVDQADMSGQVEFRSHVSIGQRAALERLLYFNACQARVSAGIAAAVENFGTPEIVVAGTDRLRVTLSEVPDTQALFAVEKESGRPVGMALYMRQDLEQVDVLHLSIAAEYASGGVRSDEQLLLKLLRELRRCTRRMKGVRRLELFYARSRNSLPRWRPVAKAAV